MQPITRFLIAAVVLLLAAVGGDARIVGSAQASADDPPRIIRLRPAKLFPEAVQVRLFVESGRYGADNRPILVSNSGRILTATERREFESALTIATYDRFTTGPACFIPHHFFRYYNRQGRQVGEVAVCFCCAQYSVSPRRGRRGETDLGRLDPKLKKLVGRMGLPTDIEC